MEHKVLTLEHDKDLIDKILEDKDMRYIILFLYVIRYDLFKDLNEPNLIESYERILILDEIYKKNIINFWNEEFIEVAVDLGLFKNIRNTREFEHKDDDFIIKLGDETITIEKDTISVPDDTLYLMINKKFKSLQRRNFNLAITRLKGVRCEKTSTIHALIFEIGEHDYTISDDLYYILDQYGNIYQAIKIEITIEGFYQRFKEIQEKVNEFITIFEPILNTKPIVKKINKALEEEKDVLEFLKEENVDLSDKFDLDKIDKENSIFKEWNSKLSSLINFRYELEEIDNKLADIKKYYSGKGKKLGYLEFIRKVSFNEDDILKIIQESLIKLRTDLVKINNEISKLTKKEIKLLNLDYERFIIMSRDD
ncbi:MAG: hypothetical protein ACFFAQ_04165 [Promethearchaeota archaeon]